MLDPVREDQAPSFPRANVALEPVYVHRHAVIGRVLTLFCGRATIRPNHRERYAGVAIVRTSEHEWEKRGHVRENHDAIWHAGIMALMAGAEAEKIILGSTSGGDSYDRQQILVGSLELSRNSMDWEKLEPHLRRMTQMLVRRHRACIERVAKALLAETTISAKKLDKLVGRSIDDVKVNAPWLRDAHRAGRQ